jgi:inorganic pyrophosphatase
VDCRVIGALQAEQTERNGDKVRNDRFIGIPEVSHLFSEIRTLEELPEMITSELEAFFKNYNEQAGKKFKVTARLSAGETAKLLKQ